MIVREWKCRVPEAHSEGFTGYLYETGIKDSSATPGFLGAQIFRRSLAGKVELTLITYQSFKFVPGLAAVHRTP